jgi:transposase
MTRNKGLSSETRQSILVLRNEGYSMREIDKKLKISYNAVYYSLHRTAQTGPNQNRKKEWEAPVHN